MRKKEVEQFKNKRIKIILSGNSFYSGFVLSIGDDFMKIRDKYDKVVFIVLEAINSIEVER